MILSKQKAATHYLICDSASKKLQQDKTGYFCITNGRWTGSMILDVLVKSFGGKVTCTGRDGKTAEIYIAKLPTAEEFELAALSREDLQRIAKGGTLLERLTHMSLPLGYVAGVIALLSNLHRMF